MIRRLLDRRRLYQSTERVIRAYKIKKNKIFHKFTSLGRSSVRASFENRMRLNEIGTGGRRTASAAASSSPSLRRPIQIGLGWPTLLLLLLWFRRIVVLSKNSLNNIPIYCSFYEDEIYFYFYFCSLYFTLLF